MRYGRGKTSLRKLGKKLHYTTSSRGYLNMKLETRQQTNKKDGKNLSTFLWQNTVSVVELPYLDSKSPIWFKEAEVAQKETGLVQLFVSNIQREIYAQNRVVHTMLNNWFTRYPNEKIQNNQKNYRWYYSRKKQLRNYHYLVILTQMLTFLSLQSPYDNNPHKNQGDSAVIYEKELGRLSKMAFSSI